MPVNGGPRGPGGNSNVKKAPDRSGMGPAADRMDGGHAGGSHPTTSKSGPSMGGVLRYIRESGSAEKTAAVPSGSQGKEEYESPYPTGGNPYNEYDDGDDIPGESKEEAARERCSECGRPHDKDRGSQGNKEMREPQRKGVGR